MTNIVQSDVIWITPFGVFFFFFTQLLSTRLPLFPVSATEQPSIESIRPGKKLETKAVHVPIVVVLICGFVVAECNTIWRFSSHHCTVRFIVIYHGAGELGRTSPTTDGVFRKPGISVCAREGERRFMMSSIDRLTSFQDSKQAQWGSSGLLHVGRKHSDFWQLFAMKQPKFRLLSVFVKKRTSSLVGCATLRKYRVARSGPTQKSRALKNWANNLIL